MNELKKKLQTIAGSLKKQESTIQVRTILNKDKLVLDRVGGGSSGFWCCSKR